MHTPNNGQAIIILMIPISRFGNVGIGIANPVRPFHLRGSNTVLQIDRDTKDPGFGITRYSPGFGEVWKSFYFYTEGIGPNNGRFIIADWGRNVKGFSTPRLVIDNVGNIGIGTKTPQQKLEVTGMTLSGNTLIGPCPIAPNFALFANNNLDQTVDGNYALKHGSNGRTILNTSEDLFFATNGVAKMTLNNGGNFGIGISNPAEKLHVEGNIQALNLKLGQWPHHPNYAFFGNNSLDQSIIENYALLQGNDGQTFLNSPLSLFLRIKNQDIATITEDGLQVNGNFNTSNASIGTWPVNSAFAYFGNNTLDQSLGENYALLQADAGQTYLNSSKWIGLRIKNQDVIRITETQRVGIGTNAPGALLHIHTTSSNAGDDNSVRFTAPNLGPIASHIHYGTDGDWYIRSAKNTGKVILQDTGGNVGIGTSTPSEKTTYQRKYQV